MTLQKQLNKIVKAFVCAVVAACMAAAKSEAPKMVKRAAVRVSRAAPKRCAASGKRYRTPATEIARQKAVTLEAARILGAKGETFGKARIMSVTGERTDLGRVLSLLAADGLLKKHGDRRLTTYTLTAKGRASA